MERVKFTEGWLAGASSGHDAQRHYRDKINTLLRLCVGRGGSKAFYVQAMVAGDRKFVVLGHHPALTLDAARTAATAQGNAWDNLRKGVVPLAVGEIPTLQQCCERHIRDANEHRRRKGRAPLKSEELMRASLKFHFAKQWVQPVSAIIPELIAEKYAAGIPGRTLACLRAALRIVVAEGLIRSPLRQLGKGIVGGNNRRELLPGLRKRQERIGDVLRAIRSYPTSMDLRIFGEFLLFSGRRPGELRTLKWSDVEFDRGVYCIREHKSARDKDDFLYAPLSDHLSELLSRWKMVRDASLKDDARDQYVFPASQVNTAEPYLSTSGYRGFATHVAKQCDLADFTAYQLRKFFISVADSIGIPQHTSYLLTGHSIPGARGAYSFALAGTMREPLQRVTDQILLYAKDPATTV